MKIVNLLLVAACLTLTGCPVPHPAHNEGVQLEMTGITVITEQYKKDHPEMFEHDDLWLKLERQGLDEPQVTNSSKPKGYYYPTTNGGWISYQQAHQCKHGLPLNWICGACNGPGPVIDLERNEKEQWQKDREAKQ